MSLNGHKYDSNHIGVDDFLDIIVALFTYCTKLYISSDNYNYCGTLLFTLIDDIRNVLMNQYPEGVPIESLETALICTEKITMCFREVELVVRSEQNLQGKLIIKIIKTTST